MMITLEDIQAEQLRIVEMIEAFKAQPHATEYRVGGVTIPLAAGERFAGQVLNADGTLSHYLIKLPGETDDLNWANARRWAVERGGVLPNRQEQSLLYANLKGEFEGAAYWSDQEHESDSSCAWCQYFYGGVQYYYRKSAALRAVAVRRFIPSVI